MLKLAISLESAPILIGKYSNGITLNLSSSFTYLSLLSIVYRVSPSQAVGPKREEFQCWTFHFYKCEKASIHNKFCYYIVNPKKFFNIILVSVAK